MNAQEDIDWEVVDPLVDDNAFSDSFGKQFKESETWKHLMRCYPDTCVKHYQRWREKIATQRKFKGKGKIVLWKSQDPTQSDIGVFHWQILHRYLPKLQ